MLSLNAMFCLFLFIYFISWFLFVSVLQFFYSDDRVKVKLLGLDGSVENVRISVESINLLCCFLEWFKTLMCVCVWRRQTASQWWWTQYEAWTIAWATVTTNQHWMLLLYVNLLRRIAYVSCDMLFYWLVARAAVIPQRKRNALQSMTSSPLFTDIR